MLEKYLPWLGIATVCQIWNTDRCCWGRRVSRKPGFSWIPPRNPLAKNDLTWTAFVFQERYQHGVTWSSWPSTDYFVGVHFFPLDFIPQKYGKASPIPTNGRMKGAKKGKRWHWMLKQYHSPYTSHLPFSHKYTYKEMLLLISKYFEISFKRFIAEMPGKLELQTHCFIYT